MAFDRPIAAITCYCEASNASPDERRAVMHTFFNRIADGRFGKTVASVCLKRYQFSEWNDDKGDNANLERAASASDHDPIILECLADFDAILAGSPDTTGAATHYHDKSISPPNWTVGATVSLETKKFIFYRGVK